jgi:Family of unknown function (DUF6188)
MAVHADIGSRLVGCTLQAIERSEHDWRFRFDSGVGLWVHCLWRIIISDRIALTNEDVGQIFGLPAPVDATATSNQLLARVAVKDVTVREDTGDMGIAFETGALLEIFNDSSGYEAWRLWDAAGWNAVAQGGGQLVFRTE